MIKTKTKIKITTKNTIERQPVPVLGENYKVKIIYKNIKIAKIDIEQKTIKISLPNKYKNTQNDLILDLAIDKMYEQIAKIEVERAMEKARIELKFAPEDYEIKEIKKELGRYENGTITINPKIAMFNKKIIDYIILHEYCHIKSKTHSKTFTKLIEKYEPNYILYDNYIKSFGYTL